MLNLLMVYGLVFYLGCGFLIMVLLNVVGLVRVGWMMLLLKGICG